MYKIMTTHQFEKPNWLLIWNQYDDELELLMLNTGTHSDLF